MLLLNVVVVVVVVVVAAAAADAVVVAVAAAAIVVVVEAGFVFWITFTSFLSSFSSFVLPFSLSRSFNSAFSMADPFCFKKLQRDFSVSIGFCCESISSCIFFCDI